jgi:hypothetical protein
MRKVMQVSRRACLAGLTCVASAPVCAAPLLVRDAQVVQLCGVS